MFNSETPQSIAHFKVKKGKMELLKDNVLL
jgi:hypothetical protein